MKNSRMAYTASTLALAFLLAACGGGGGGIASTPTPTPGTGGTPTPTPPPPTYLTLAQIIAQGGDRSFDTGGVEYSTGDNFAKNGKIDKFGAGPHVAYQASTGNYTVSEPGATTVVFNDPHDVLVRSDDNSWLGFRNGNSNFTILVPQINGIVLSYTLLGNWSDPQTIRVGVGGVPTLRSDVPVSGTASYLTGVGGSIIPHGGTSLALPGSGASGTFSVNFASATVSTTMVLKGTDPNTSTAFDFGTLTGSGMIDSGGPGFSGTLSQAGGSGLFSGAFFGPQATEFGYAWVFQGGNFDGAGVNVGKKN